MAPEEYGADEIARMVAGTLTKKMGTPEDVARAVLFFCEGTDFATGATLVLDGGRLIALISRLEDFRVTPIPSRVAVLASGGLDSSVLLGEVARRGRRVFPVYVRAGLKWEDAELAALRRFLRALGRKNIEPVTVLRLPTDDIAAHHWSVTGRNVPGYRAATASNYIAGRNLSLLAKAAVFCALRRIGRSRWRRWRVILFQMRARNSSAPSSAPRNSA